MRDPTTIKRMTEHERALIRSVLHPPYMPRIISRDWVWEEERGANQRPAAPHTPAPAARHARLRQSCRCHWQCS